MKTLENIQKVAQAIEALGLEDSDIVAVNASQFEGSIQVFEETWRRLGLGTPSEVRGHGQDGHFHTTRDGVGIVAIFHNNRPPVAFDMATWANQVLAGMAQAQA